MHFISETVIAYRKTITRTGCNELLYFLMYKLGSHAGNTISLSVSIFVASTKLKTLKLVLTCTKYVREPWLNIADFKKSVKSF